MQVQPTHHERLTPSLKLSQQHLQHLADEAVKAQLAINALAESINNALPKTKRYGKSKTK